MLHRSSAEVAEYVFGDEVTAIRDGAAGVDVEFARRNAERGEHGAALVAYDARLRKPTKIARSGNAGPFLAPPTRRRIQLRDWSFASRPVFRTMMWMADKFATDDALPVYDLR